MNARSKTNPSRHAFAIALREGAVIGALGALLLALVVIAPVFSYYTDLYGGDQVVYEVVYAYGQSYYNFAYPVLAALLGFVQALFSFRLLTNRCTSNTYFGLGLSRRQLFDARFAAGVFWLGAAVLAAMGGGAAVNLFHSDHAGLILSRAAYLGAGLLTSALVAYALTALVCTQVGTLAEAVVYGPLALLLPTLLITGLSNQMHVFLRGFPYGYDLRYNSISHFNLPGTLSSELTAFNPLFFFRPFFEKYAVYIVGTERYASGAEALTWGPMPGWLAVAAALTLLARRSFAARQVENTGLLSACRPLAVAVTVPALWAASSAFLSMTEGYVKIPLPAALAAGGALAAMATAALYFPLRVAGRGAWRGLWALPATLAAAGLSVTLLAGGGFGYSGYVPDASSVASVEITYKGLPGLAPSSSYNSGSLPSYENNSQITLTDPGDVALACSLHRSLASDSASEGVSISNYTLVRYTLKDGRTMTRFYRTATAETLRAMLALDDTAAFADAVAAAFEDPARCNPEWDYSHPVSSFTADVVYLAGPLSTQATLLDADTLASVRQALADDLRNQSPTPATSPRIRRPARCIFSMTVGAKRPIPQKSWRRIR
jgi:hypothetical protein